MKIARLSLENYRRFESGEFTFGGGVTVIAGRNGAGKTSLLEAVFFLSCGRGLRGAKQADIIRFGQSSAVIDAGIDRKSTRLNSSH